MCQDCAGRPGLYFWSFSVACSGGVEMPYQRSALKRHAGDGVTQRSLFCCCVTVLSQFPHVGVELISDRAVVFVVHQQHEYAAS